MQFDGFPSITDYERECARLGYATERRPYHDRTGGRYFVLITAPPGHPTGTSVCSWDLFTTDEAAELLSGIVPDAAWMARTGGMDRNFSGLLAEHGYFPDAPAEGRPPELAAEDVGDDWQQLSLFG